MTSDAGRLRRRLLMAAAALPLVAHAAPAARPDAKVVPGASLRFPDDEGSHPDFRIEWWYVTGWLRAAQRGDLGFQVTFFRHRNAMTADNPSRFAAHQLLVAHAALSDPRSAKLTHVQRAGRAMFDRAAANEGRTDVRIGDWSLAADGTDRIVARIPDRALQLDLVFTRTQPPLLHGDNGFSRKGPEAEAASYYYTLPHLAVTGTVRVARDGRSNATSDATHVEGCAWLDHEWSSAYMPANASGWDWIGINLGDGGALMAFRMRDRGGGAVWASATLRNREGATRTFAPADVRWTASRQWRSPRTGATYPVAWRIDIGDLAIDIEPMMDDQEQDARITTGTVYWEGAVTARSGGNPIGRGYLEMTGYAGTLRL